MSHSPSPADGLRQDLRALDRAIQLNREAALIMDLLNWQQLFGAKTPPQQRQTLPFSRRARRFRRAVRKAPAVAKK